MRWDSLSAQGSGRAASATPPLPLALPGAVTRTFDTPGFAGMTFYEVRAKSIINRVPGASRVMFDWTINPYRGCSHACTYCLAGDTPVLMADGRTQADRRPRHRRPDLRHDPVGQLPAIRRHPGARPLVDGAPGLPGDARRRHVAGGQRRPPVPHRARLEARHRRDGRRRPAAPPDQRQQADGRRPVRDAATGVGRLPARLPARHGSVATPAVNERARSTAPGATWPTADADDGSPRRRRQHVAGRRPMPSATTGARASSPASSTPTGSHDGGALRITSVDRETVDFAAAALTGLGFRVRRPA